MRVLYKLIRKILFCFQPEVAHRIALRSLQVLTFFGFKQKVANNPCQLMGLTFQNRIGIAAGLDKNAEFIDALASLGVGFIEVGSVSPLPRSGNLKPRLFRIARHNALINRMGLCNIGLTQFVNNLQQAKFQGVVGVNLAKNKNTEPKDAVEDYLLGMQAVYPYASYITINISCPHEAGLRTLQFGEHLQKLLSTLKAEQATLTAQYRRYVPLAIKISPDLNQLEIELICDALKAHGIDAVIATNTTTERPAIADLPVAKEMGGLSGIPLFEKSLNVVSLCHQHLKDEIPIIAAGGIQSMREAQAMLAAGAQLIQIYTGLVYQGPALVSELAVAVANSQLNEQQQSYSMLTALNLSDAHKCREHM